MIEFKHDEDVSGVINHCQEFINEYQKYELLPDRLKFIEKKLSAYYSFLVRKKAIAQAMQNTHYWIRKVSHSRESIRARKSSSSQVQADHIANDKIEKEIEDETYSVWRYEDLNGFCKALDKVFVSIAHQLKSYEQDRINQR
jgi:hypothetical protein